MTSNTTQRGKMNHRRQNLKNVTHEEIENAMKRYLDNGGTIKQLDNGFYRVSPLWLKERLTNESDLIRKLEECKKGREL